MAKSEHLSMRITPKQRAAIEATAAARGLTMAEFWDVEATFARIEDALGASKAAIVRVVYGAVIQRLEALKRLKRLTQEQRAEVGPLAQWLGFLFAPLAEYDAEPAQFAGACERLLRYVPESIAAAVTNIPEQIQVYTTEAYASDFYGGTLPGEGGRDDQWTADIHPRK